MSEVGYLDIAVVFSAMASMLGIIIALLKMIWAARKEGHNKDIERLQKEIDRQDTEIKDLRVRKHDNIAATEHLAGRVHSVEEGIESVQRRIFMDDQRRTYEEEKRRKHENMDKDLKYTD